MALLPLSLHQARSCRSTGAEEITSTASASGRTLPSSPIAFNALRHQRRGRQLRRLDRLFQAPSALPSGHEGAEEVSDATGTSHLPPAPVRSGSASWRGPQSESSSSSSSAVDASPSRIDDEVQLLYPVPSPHAPPLSTSHHSPLDLAAGTLLALAALLAARLGRSGAEDEATDLRALQGRLTAAWGADAAAAAEARLAAEAAAAARAAEARRAVARAQAEAARRAEEKKELMEEAAAVRKEEERRLRRVAEQQRRRFEEAEAEAREKSARRAAELAEERAARREAARKAAEAKAERERAEREAARLEAEQEAAEAAQALARALEAEEERRAERRRAARSRLAVRVEGSVSVRATAAGDELPSPSANFPASAFGGGVSYSSPSAPASVVVEARAETVVGGAPGPKARAAAATAAGAAAAAREVSSEAAVGAVDAFLGAALLPGGILDRSENSMSEPERRHWMRVAALRAAAAADEAAEAAVAAATGAGGAASEEEEPPSAGRPLRLRSAFEAPFEARTEHFVFPQEDPRSWDSILGSAIERATRAPGPESKGREEALAAFLALAEDVEAEALAPSSSSSYSSSSPTVSPPDMRGLGLGLGAALVAAAAADAAAFSSRTSMPSEDLSSSSSNSLDKTLLSLLQLSTKKAPPDSLERPARWFSAACSSAAAGGAPRARGVRKAFSDLAERNASREARERRATARASEREAAERAAVAEAYFPSREETARAAAAERAAAVPYPERIAANSSLAETLLDRGASRTTAGERTRARSLLEECVLLKEAWSSRRKVRGTEALSYSPSPSPPGSLASSSSGLHPSPAPELLRLAEFLEKGTCDAEAAGLVRSRWVSCLRLVADRLVSVNKNDFRAAAMLLASAADAAEGSAPGAAEEAREHARKILIENGSALAFVGNPGPELSRRVSAAFSEPVGGLVSTTTRPRDLWDAGGLPRW